jgi:hypothetical protein
MPTPLTNRLSLLIVVNRLNQVLTIRNFTPHRPNRD